jgi:formate hydrogenlyase subunit 6/NADH:ubiquinone oxidoreductase subunit I
MSYLITKECIVCGLCAEICPVEAIKGYETPDSIDKYRFEVDTDACIECGECEENCPTKAIITCD